MPSDNIENSFDVDVIMDDMKDDPEVKRLKTIKMLKELLETVRINRRAIEIIRALDAGNRNKAAEIAVEAKKAGIDPDDLKAACRAQRKK